MGDLVASFGFALLMWWLSTGFILFLNHLHPATYRWSLSIASLLVIGALLGIASGSDDTSRLAAVVAFAQALIVWAWLEMSYFMGVITGPRKSACPPGISGWSRFFLALKTSLYHELAVIALGLGVLTLTWNGDNQVAAGTFATLWLMRWSAKLNLFFGVPNVNIEWFPEPLRFLHSYMRRRAINLFFPFSVTVATGLVAWLIGNAVATSDVFIRTSYALIGSLMALAVVEHWFLVLPLRDSALWDWALRLAGQTTGGNAASDHPGSPPSKSLKRGQVWQHGEICVGPNDSQSAMPLTPVTRRPWNSNRAPKWCIFCDKASVNS